MIEASYDPMRIQFKNLQASISDHGFALLAHPVATLCLSRFTLEIDRNDNLIRSLICDRSRVDGTLYHRQANDEDDDNADAS